MRAMFALGLLLPLGAAAADWEFMHEKDGIRVYHKHIEGTSVVAFKGEAVIEASPAKIAAVLADTPRKLEWVHAIKEARLVKEISPLERVEYNHTHTPWPLTDRDFLFHAKAEADAVSKTVKFTLHSVEDSAEPPQKGKVRGRLIESGYFLEPLEQGKRTKLTVEIHADPLGSVPKWIINLFQKKWPLRTIRGIREQVKKPEIAEHPVIVELFKAGKK